MLPISPGWLLYVRHCSIPFYDDFMGRTYARTTNLPVPFEPHEEDFLTAERASQLRWNPSQNHC
jgi:hypothetical protein